jgi:DnaJ-class molecular chaperone
MGFENQFEQKEHPTCPKCKGSGTVKNEKDESVTCPACGGSGKVK